MLPMRCERMKRLLSEKLLRLPTASWVRRRFAAATIFMDLVICRVLSMLFILLRIARMFATCPTSFLSVLPRRGPYRPSPRMFFQSAALFLKSSITARSFSRLSLLSFLPLSISPRSSG